MTLGLGALAVAITTVHQAQVEAVLERGVEAQQRALLGSVVEQLEADFRLRGDALQAAAAQIGPALLREPARMHEKLASQPGMSHLFSHVVAWNGEGGFVASAPLHRELQAIEVAGHPAFRQAMGGRDVVISPIGMNPRAAQRTVNLLAPVFGPDLRPIGVLVGVLDMNADVLAHLARLRIGETGYVTLATAGERPLYVLHPDAERVMQPAPFARPVRHDAPAALALGTTDDGRAALVGRRTIEPTGWTASVVYPVDEAYAELAAQRRRMTLAALAAMALVLPLVWWTVGRRLQPLEAMRQALRREANGVSASPRLAETGDAELRELARAFNAMMSARERAETQLEEQAARLSTIVAAVPALIGYWDAEERTVFLDAKYGPAFGVDVARAIGLPLRHVVGEEVYVQIELHVAAVLCGHPQQFERVVTRGGVQRIELVEYVPDIDARGVVKGLFSFVQDVTKARRTQDALDAHRRHLQLVVDNAPALIAQVDAESRFVFANAAYLRSVAAGDSGVIGRRVAEVLGAARYAQWRDDEQRALAGERVCVERSVGPPGATLHQRVELVPSLDETGACRGYFVFVNDVSEYRRMQAQLADSEARMRLIADNMPALMSYIDLDLRYRFVNQGYVKHFGRPLEEIVDRPVREVLGESTFRVMEPLLRRALAGERVDTVVELALERGVEFFRATYTPHRDAQRQVIGFYGLTFDVTQQMLATRRLSELARVDALTGLPNRLEFNERLPQAIERYRGTDGAIALMFLDVDHFKRINDGHGHAAGDEVLREFARRIKTCVRPGDVTVRLAGDEFVVLLDGVDDAAAAAAVARRVVAAMEPAFRLDNGVQLAVSTSIGVAMDYGGRLAPKSLMARADEALYRAKRAGRNTFELLEPPTTRAASLEAS